MYVYRTEQIEGEDWFVVGFYKPNGGWVSESEWAEQEAAATRVNFLNGGTGNPFPD